MRHHRVLDRRVGQDVLHRDAALLERHQRTRRAARHVEPDRVARGRERRVAERHAERFADDLRGRRGAEELTAAAGRCAGATAEFGRLLERELAVDEPHANRLHPSGIVAFEREERDAAGDEHAGQVMGRRERHHHGRQPFVAGCHTEDAAPRGERSNQPAEDGRRVVPVGEAVEHRRRALRTAIAGVRAGGGEWNRASPFEFVRRGLHEEADFPVPGVVAERDRRAVGRANAAVRRQDEELIAADGGRLPAHAGVLRPPEDIAGGTRPQHLRGQRERAHRAGNVRGHVEEGRIVNVELIGAQCRYPSRGDLVRVANNIIRADSPAVRFS